MVRRSYQKGRIQARQRKAGTIWVLRYRIKEGTKWIDKTEELRGCTSESQARAAAAARMRKVNQVNSADRPATTLNEFAAGLWKEYVKRIKPSTAYSYKSMLDLHILPVLGDRSLVAIAPADVTQFLKGRAGEGLVDKTLLNIYSLLAVMFTCAVEYDLIDVSPVRRKLHRPRPATAEKPVLNPDEIKRVIENIGAEYRPLFVCLALTGLRKGELFGLRWSDVDLSNRKPTADIYTHVHDASEEATETLAREILGDWSVVASIEGKVN